ncbi:MAG: YeeE/YedE thiosulfate transporter family protein, partial [Gammaproteobacteria bacterium]|nr:YeeE/YedE thiosulfate transporter family protein [Gammaproteobacteria bacterium]
TPAPAGTAIGLNEPLQHALTGRPLGCSSPLGQACATVSRLPFFQREFAANESWRLWFIVGLPFGGLFAALSAGQVGWVLDMGTAYEAMLPKALWLKALVLFTGGVLMGLGARLAGGCTSGHTIVGVALLNPPSVLASILFFVGGLAMVQALWRLTGAS